MHVAELLQSRVRRIKRLRSIEAEARATAGLAQDELLMYLAIETLNLWTQFCRSYVLTSATGLRSLTGVRWRSRLTVWKSREDVRKYLVQTQGKGKRNVLNPLDEPTWRNLGVVFRCCSSLKSGNDAAVRKAQGLTSRFHSELPDVRNFAAHKCEGTRVDLDRIAKSRGQPPVADLAVVMLAPGRSGHGTVTTEWLSEIETSMMLMCR